MASGGARTCGSSVPALTAAPPGPKAGGECGGAGEAGAFLKTYRKFRRDRPRQGLDKAGLDEALTRPDTVTTRRKLGLLG